MHDQYFDRNSSDMKHFDQYYTPLKVSKRMAELVNDWFPDVKEILDACCGYGSLATYIKKKEIY
jgi:type I restriction-modification system DNA methylase subunit